MKMSYKAAWDAINEMNKLSEVPIVTRETGGKGGGGTVLTDKGLEYIRIYKHIEASQRSFFDTIEQYADDLRRLEAFTSQPSLRTSARNQLLGEVVAVTLRDTTCDVVIRIAADTEIVVSVTEKSAQELDIQKGTMLYVLLKSSWITLFSHKPNVIPSQNLILAVIDEIDTAQKQSEVTLRFGENTKIVATVENEILESSVLKEGDQSWCMFETSAALLAV